MFRSSHSVVVLFRLLAFVFGFLFVLVTPPFQAPDEIAHFYRAYQISEGQLRPQKMNDVIGGMLPSSIGKTATVTGIDIFFHPERKLNLAELRKYWSFKLNPEIRSLTGFANSAHYPPTIYLPQALGICIARQFTDFPILMLYFGRISNLVIWIFLISYAIRIIPCGKYTIMMLALAPMSIFQAASLSGDVMTNSAGFLYIAFIIKGLHLDGMKFNRWIASIYALTFFLWFVKPGYFPLVLLLFAVPLKAYATKYARILHRTLLLMLPAIVQYLWRGTIAEISVMRRGVDPFQQILNILSNNDGIAVSYFHSFIVSIPGYISSFIGILGWYDIDLSWWMKLPFLIILVIVSWTGAGDLIKLARWQKLAFLGIGLLNFLLIVTVLLLTWTKLGERNIDGVQGRYFIPFGPLFFLGLQSSIAEEKQHTWIPAIAILTVTFSLCYSVIHTFFRYYI